MKLSENLVLDIKTTNARVNIESYPPKLNVKTIKAEMKLERQAPAFKRVRVRKPNALRKQQITRLHHPEAKSFIKDTVKYITADKKSKNVHRLENNISNLHPGDDPLGGINAALQQENEVNEQLIWDPGDVKTTWTQPRTILEWEIRRPKITVEAHSVEIKVRRQARIRFSPKPAPRQMIDKKV